MHESHIRCMLTTANLPQKFWAEAIHHAVYISNRVYTSCLDNMTPFEAIYEEPPDISHLQVFRSLVHTLIPDTKRKKMDPKSQQGIVLSIDNNSKAYRVFLLQSK